jgi:hypothetical protein
MEKCGIKNMENKDIEDLLKDIQKKIARIELKLDMIQDYISTDDLFIDCDNYENGLEKIINFKNNDLLI